MSTAISLVSEYNACLVLITVVPDKFMSPVDAGSAAALSDVAIKLVRHHHESVANVPMDVSVESHIAYGNPKRRVLEQCVSCRCDLVVLPHPGRRRGLERLTKPSMLGVAEECNVPVLLVGPRGEDEGPAALNGLEGLAQG